MRTFLVALLVGVLGAAGLEGGRYLYHLRQEYQQEQQRLQPLVRSLLDTLDGPGEGWRLGHYLHRSSVLERRGWRLLLADDPNYFMVEVGRGDVWVDVTYRFDQESKNALNKAGWARWRALRNELFLSACSELPHAQDQPAGDNKAKD